MSKRTKNSRKDIALQKINDRITETKADSSLLSFNYKYFLFGEDYGESFQEWEKEKILADLNEKLKVFSAKTAVELEQDGTLEKKTYRLFDESARGTFGKISFLHRFSG